MAERRMFAKTIIDSDAFLDMPLSTQALYFHLSMRADDDGFINNPKKISRIIGASEDDLKLLIAKRFIIPFDSGVVVIKHWKIHNYIQSDRYKETVYREEKTMLEVKPNKAYTLKKNNELEGKTQCIQNVYSLDTQVRLDKDSIDKDSIDKSNIIDTNVSMSVETDLQLAKSNVNYQKVMDYWNKNSKLKEITVITEKRKGHLNARIKEHGIDAIYKAIDNVANSAFLRGENNRGWIANFDWVFKPNNFIKVLEGNYLDKTPNDFENDIARRAEKIKSSWGIK